MNRQTANLRVGTVAGFGDDATREKYERECQSIRKGMTTRFQVAPRARIITATGRAIEPGQPVNLTDFHGWSEPAWVLLERAVREGLVLESESA